MRDSVSPSVLFRTTQSLLLPSSAIALIFPMSMTASYDGSAIGHDGVHSLQDPPAEVLHAGLGVDRPYFASFPVPVMLSVPSRTPLRAFRASASSRTSPATPLTATISRQLS